MSSASLAIHRTHRAHPDSARIAAISAAIALNLAVILIASRPITPLQLAVVRQLAPVQLIRLINPPKVMPVLEPIKLQPLKHPAMPLAHVRPIASSPVKPVVIVPGTEGNVAVQPANLAMARPSIETGTSVKTEPVEASLAYRSSPLQFPLQALRQRLHGTVLLRVLVDETGKPQDVAVEHSSGSALLDRSAREQVLATWRFQPAMVNGHHVRAWARVPVSFDLREQ